MRRRREEEQTERLFGMFQREAGGDRRAKRMACYDCLVDAALVHQTGDGVGLTIGKAIFRAATLGIAMAGAVDEQQVGTALQRPAKGEELVAQIAAGAMDEQDRRQVRGRSSRQQHRIHPEAADIDQLTDTGRIPLDDRRLPAGEGQQQTNGDEQEKDDDHGGRTLRAASGPAAGELFAQRLHLFLRVAIGGIDGQELLPGLQRQ